MKRLFSHIFIAFVAFGLSQNAVSQGYSLKISKVSFRIDSTNISGYSTSFDNPYKEVKKKWWRYVNKKALIFNKQSHYELTIPAQRKGSNTSLKFVSQLTKGKSKLSVLKIGAISSGMSDDQLKKFDLELKNMLRDFKIEYFTTAIQIKINDKEVTAKRISNEMDKYYLHNSKLHIWVNKKPEEKDKFFGKIEKNKKEIEKLRTMLLNTDNEMNNLKKELNQIK